MTKFHGTPEKRIKGLDHFNSIVSNRTKRLL